MKFLIFGAGVLGSLYAGRLQQAGHDVSILARGRPLREICDRGLILEHAFTDAYAVIPVRVVAELNVFDRYDYVIVFVRNNQANEALATVGKNIETPNILVIVNNVMGYQEWIKALGKERLMVGFAGAGGTRENGVVKHALAPSFFQPTTLAELSGQPTPRLLKLVHIFIQAGFPTTTSTNMEAWQKSHVAWVSPLANAIYMAEKRRLALDKSGQIWSLTVQVIRESYLALEKLSVPITPPVLNIWRIAPTFLLVELLRVWTKTRRFKILILRHALAARDEMMQLASEFTELVKEADISAPAFQTLKSYATDLVK